EGGHVLFHSHLAAVKPGLQGHNVGYQLKMAQRERVLTKGIDVITWTVDPLQSRNAYLNFLKLGVYADKYIVNFYGEETSSSLHSFGTDRFLVTWPLKNPNRIEAGPRIEKARTLVAVDAAEAPVLRDVVIEGDVVVEIPDDINAIFRRSRDAAMAWRE